MRILIIEDDLDTQEFLKKRLEEKCFAVDVATTCSVATKHIQAHTYDIILLDYSLPDRDGISFIQEIRSLENQSKKNVPIIMISVTNELMNKISALEYGADDYIPKPFFFAELFARIQAILRRPQIQSASIINLGKLVIDTSKQQVQRDGKPIHLTRKEFSLLEYLIKNEGSIISRTEITEHIWDMNIDPFSNTIDTHITNLRKKLETGEHDRIIQNIPGRGYIIDLIR